MGQYNQLGNKAHTHTHTHTHTANFYWQAQYWYTNFQLLFLMKNIHSSIIIIVDILYICLLIAGVFFNCKHLFLILATMCHFFLITNNHEFLLVEIISIEVQIRIFVATS